MIYDGIVLHNGEYHVYVKIQDGTEQGESHKELSAAIADYKQICKFMNGIEKEPKVYEVKPTETMELVEISNQKSALFIGDKMGGGASDRSVREEQHLSKQNQEKVDRVRGICKRMDECNQEISVLTHKVNCKNRELTQLKEELESLIGK